MSIIKLFPDPQKISELSEREKIEEIKGALEERLLRAGEVKKSTILPNGEYLTIHVSQSNSRVEVEKLIEDISKSEFKLSLDSSIYFIDLFGLDAYKKAVNEFLGDRLPITGY